MAPLHPRQVDAFRAVMIAGSMTAAARRLGVSQPAISRLVRDLERNLGLKLFERDGVRLLPRDEALRLYREAERLYVGLDHLARMAGEIRAARGGVLRIGAAPSLSICCAEDAVPRFAAARPDVAVMFDTESSSRIADVVAIQHYDIGLVLARQGQARTRDETLVETDAVCVAPFDHPLARQSRVTASDLTRMRVILPGRGTSLRASIDAVLKEAASSAAAPIETSLANCCKLAAKGLGVAIVDSLSAAEFRDALAIRPFLPRIAVRYAALFPFHAPRSLIVDEFVALVRDAAAGRLSEISFDEAGRPRPSPVSKRRGRGTPRRNDG